MLKNIKLFTLCLLLTLLSLTAGQDDIDGYFYKGEGTCLDSNQDSYDAVVVFSSSAFVSDNCVETCEQVDSTQNSKHVAFYYGPAFCMCYYENGEITKTCLGQSDCAEKFPNFPAQPGQIIFSAGENLAGDLSPLGWVNVTTSTSLSSSGTGCVEFVFVSYATEACYERDSTGCNSLDVCFSSNSVAEVKNKGSTRMDEIHVGDQVLTGSGDYRTVYTIDHHHVSKRTKFLQVSCQRTSEHLELTPLHMVYLEGHLNPVPAATLDIGDKFKMNDGPCTIDKISTITRNGLFSPITTDGTIVVNGVVASTYSAYFNENGYIDIGGYNILSHQAFFDKALKPYKLICTGLSLELCKTTKEKVTISELAWIIFGHWKGQNKVYQISFFVIMVPFLYMIDSVLTWYKFFVASLFVFVVWRKKIKTNMMKM